MSFISLAFAIFFLIFVLCYHFAGRFAKNGALAQKILFFAASLVFYASADLRFLPFLAYAIVLSYFAGLAASSDAPEKNRKILFALFLAADLLPLLFCKYSPAHLIFPLGISFFTFQSISYIADCYTKKIKAERSLLNVALFISFFPTISSGPIQRAGTLIPQFEKAHRFDYDCAADGLKLFAWGMFKKLCVADRIAVYVNYVYGGAESQYGAALLLATVLYSFQIYCDFSGYSDMAIGVAKFCGYDIGKNFDHPYLSKSVGEFWRRWHISLSSWLRDYVYIPLGGSRVALPRIYFNLLATFFVSGIWHGAGWTFIVWGLLHGIFQCVGRATKSFWERLKLPAFARIFITFCLVTFAWIFFRAQSLGQAATVIRKICELPKCAAAFFAMRAEMGTVGSIRTLFSFVDDACGGFKGMACILCMLLIFVAASLFTNGKDGLEIVRKKPLALRWILYFALCALIFYCSKTGMSGNFIYKGF